MKKNIVFIATLVILSIVTIVSCKKDDALELAVAPQQAHFLGGSSGGYSITTPTTVYKIPVGITSTSSVERKVTISVSSPSGAVIGTHYTLNKTVLTIPAGQAIDTLVVSGIQARYLAGRKDTLVFTIQEPDVKSADFDNKFTLVMRGPCFEGDVNLAEFLGDYNNTKETYSDNGNVYGPYKTTVKSFTQLPGATTGTITIANLYDDGWNDLTFTLDWTDPANRRVTLVSQSTGYNAGNLNAMYAGYIIDARPTSPVQFGTFSICNQTIVVKFRLCFTLGCFARVYTESLSR